MKQRFYVISSLVRRLTLIITVMLLALACQRKEGGVLDAIHQTVDEARSRQKVQIDIRTEKPDASPAELQLQQTIEKQIEQEHVAHVVNDGSGPGYVRINVEVDDKVTSVEKIRKILRTAGVLERSTVKIVM